MSKVIVFGASATDTWEPIYQEAILLGKKLAMYGHEVWNGGYFGLMGAVSRGAFSEGGVVVGVTSKTFSFRSGENPWLSRKIEADDSIQRLKIMLTECDIAIALPGSIGTLNEILMLLTLWKVREIKMPLIAWKSTYMNLLNHLNQNQYLDSEALSKIFFVDNTKDIFERNLIMSV